MSLFTVTINNLSPAMEKQNQELAKIAEYVGYALSAARGAGGAQTTGNIYAPGGATVVGNWAYVAQAAS